MDQKMRIIKLREFESSKEWSDQVKRPKGMTGLENRSGS